MSHLRIPNFIAMALLIIGGLNWLAIGAFNFDVIAAIVGGANGSHGTFARVIYVVVGLAAIYGLYLFKPLGEEHEHLPHSRA